MLSTSSVSAMVSVLYFWNFSVGCEVRWDGGLCNLKQINLVLSSLLNQQFLNVLVLEV